MDAEHRIKLLKWLDKATPEQLEEFDRKLEELKQQGELSPSVLYGGDEQFEEVCHVCGQIKMVHVDMNTNLGNPGFICDDCDR